MSSIGRRGFLLSTTAVTLPLLTSACSKNEAPKGATEEPPPVKPAQPSMVRVASVPTAVEGEVLPALAKGFEAASSLSIELTATSDPYDHARRGEADLVVSHYGHRDAETFVLEGLGEWPRTIFSNQMALLGPPSDPAGIRGLEDAGEAFRRIAASRSPYLVNDIDGVRYLTEILWNAAGRPDKRGWFLDGEKHRKDDAVVTASQLGAYICWGLTPYLRHDRLESFKLEPLVLGDPLLQRMLVSIVVKPGKYATNVEGARAFEKHLLSPPVQAKIREVRYPGTNGVCWVPAGRHNRTAVLPKG